MKIYLASNRENIALVKSYAERLEACGFEISYKWWRDIEQNGPDDREVSVDVLTRCADADLRGVDDASIFWLLAPEKGGTGCWVELGYAIGQTCNNLVVISGFPERTLFSLTTMAHALETYESHEEAFESIKPYGDVAQARLAGVP